MNLATIFCPNLDCLARGQTGRGNVQVHSHKEKRCYCLELQQVQADEIKVKRQGGYIWMAMAMMVSSRLWLAGVISPQRDRHLIQAVVDQAQVIALCRPLLVAVDGLASYVTAFQRAFRSPLPRHGQPGRCRLCAWSELAIVQVVKQRVDGQLTIVRRCVQGSAEQVTRLLTVSQGGGHINTAFIERLNATFRQRLPWLTRRCRYLARQPETLQASMFVLGCVYNFCTYHHSLRLALHLPHRRRRWLHRTPAIAAGLTDHRWSIAELFEFRVPPPRWSPPKRRGRHSKHTLQLINHWCI